MFYWNLNGKNGHVLTEKFEIEYGDESKLLADLEFTDIQTTEARIKKISYLLESYCTCFMLLIEDPVGK